MKKTNGFSLVELMVVIGIAAILAAVGMPIYTNLTMKNNRHEATAELISIASAADNYEIRNGDFPTTLSSFWHQTTTDNGYYTMAYTHTANATKFTITATAIGTQSGDTACSVIEYEIDGAVSNKTPTDCWA